MLALASAFRITLLSTLTWMIRNGAACGIVTGRGTNGSAYSLSSSIGSYKFGLTDICGVNNNEV